MKANFPVFIFYFSCFTLIKKNRRLVRLKKCSNYCLDQRFHCQFCTVISFPIATISAIFINPIHLLQKNLWKMIVLICIAISLPSYNIILVVNHKHYCLLTQVERCEPYTIIYTVVTLQHLVKLNFVNNTWHRNKDVYFETMDSCID